MLFGFFKRYSVFLSVIRVFKRYSGVSSVIRELSMFPMESGDSEESRAGGMRLRSRSWSVPHICN